MNYSNNSSSSNAKSSSMCNGTKYVIQKGDTLYSISRRYNVPLALILRANPYVDVYNLMVGDVVCIPSEQESSAPARPPVVMGPGPVIMPEEQNEASDNLLEAEPVAPVVTGPAPVNTPTSSMAEGTASIPETPVYTAPVTIPARNDGRQERSAGQTSTPSATPSQNVRTEMGSRNTFNFNYYGGSDTSKEYSETREKKSTPRNQAPKMTPARGTGSVRQTVPERRSTSNVSESAQTQRTRTVAQPVPVRQTAPARQTAESRQTVEVRQPSGTSTQTRMTVPVRRPKTVTQRMMPEYQPEERSQSQRITFEAPSMANQPKMVARTRMVAPVRIISQPVSDVECEKDSCNRWNAYQDRERFNSIMYSNQRFMEGECQESCSSRCTENVFAPSDSYQSCNQACTESDKTWEDSSEEVTLISYMSRDNDTLQDILDYFSMNLSELFVYTIPNEIKLKPGCMIRVRGKGDDR